MKKIIHFRNKCIGCGMCEIAAPEYFEMSKTDGLATLKGGIKNKNTFQRNCNPGDEEKIQKAAANCPVKIIQF